MADPVLSKSRFNAACLRGSRYTGKVETLDTVRWVPVCVPRSRPLSSPNDIYTGRNERYVGTIHILVSDKLNPAAEKARRKAEEFQQVLELESKKETARKNFIDLISAHYERMILNEIEKGMSIDFFELEKKKNAIKSQGKLLIDKIKANTLMANEVPHLVLYSPEYKQYAKIVGFQSSPRDISGEHTLKQSLSEYEKWVSERAKLDPFATQFAAQPFNQVLAAGLGGGLALGFMTEAGFFTLTTELAGYKATGSFIGQGLVNGFSEVNYIGVAADAFLAPGLGAVTGSGLEYRPFSEEDKFRMVGYNKSIQQFGIDAGTSYSFNKGGGLGIGKFQPYLNTIQQKVFYNITLNYWLNYSIYGTAKKLNEKYKTDNSK